MSNRQNAKKPIDRARIIINDSLATFVDLAILPYLKI
jgi:hypothetical protein